MITFSVKWTKLTKICFSLAVISDFQGMMNVAVWSVGGYKWKCIWEGTFTYYVGVHQITLDNVHLFTSVFTLAQMPHRRPCDNSQCCHWSIAVLAEYHIYLTASLKWRAEKYGDTTITRCWTRVGHFFDHICLYYSRQAKWLIDKVAEIHLSTTAGVTVFCCVYVLLRNPQCTAQWPMEASLVQTCIVQPVVWLSRGCRAFTPQTNCTRVRWWPYQDHFYREFSWAL